MTGQSKHRSFDLLARFVPGLAILALAQGMAFGAVFVNDSFADGGRNDGVDAQDTNWWASTATNAIEVGPGFLGLVSGTSGRGIHGTFASQTLGIGDTLTATYTFTTPATVSSAGVGTGFRAGFFDTTGKPGLAADLSASSGSPNAIYNNLSGYMTDLDVNTATSDVALRERTNAASGQLLAATGDYTALGNGGTVGYAFAANTSYTGVFSITRTAAGLDLTGSISQGASLLSTFTASDATASTTSFGMLGFHANSNTFGSSNTVNAADNGIDFSNIRIDFIPAVPEPASAAAISAGLIGLCRRRK